MDAVQLPLIPELVTIRTDVAPQHPPGKFQAPSSGPDAMALVLLLSSPLPVQQLLHISGGEDEGELVARLRGYGLMLPGYQVPEVDTVGHTRSYTVYELTAADARRITRWLKKSGGRHG